LQKEINQIPDIGQPAGKEKLPDSGSCHKKSNKIEIQIIKKQTNQKIVPFQRL